MSVPKYKRTLSGIEFIQIPLDIQDLLIRLSAHWPKKWRFTVTEPVIKLADELAKNVIIGNSFFPATSSEFDDKLRYFNYAKGILSVLECKISWLYDHDRFKDTCLRTTDKGVTYNKLDKDYLKKGNYELITKKIIEEQKLLTKIIKKVRRQRKEKES